MRAPSLGPLLLAVLIADGASGYHCVDETGNKVDYFDALKAADSGQYFIATSTDGSFATSAYSLDTVDGGAIVDTITQLYTGVDPDNVAYVAYSDQPPPDDEATSTYAHAKGVLITDDSSGFYLVHSMPHWPPLMSDGLDALPDDTYGQSFLCITISTQTADAIAQGLLVSRPYVYESQVSSGLSAQLPNLAALADHDHNSDDDTWVTDFKSFGGQPFRRYDKSKYWAEDLYEDLVAPQEGDDLYVETWRDGSGGRMPSFCGDGSLAQQYPKDYDVYEVAEVAVNGVSWLGTEDHSKWAAGVSSSFVCVGGINRMCSQENRGGGTACTTSSSLHAAFTSTISSTEDCWAYDPCTGSSECYWC